MDIESWDGQGMLPTLYTRTATGAVNFWAVWVEGPDVCTSWGQQGGVQQRSRFTCKPKNEGKTNETTAERQAIKEAIATWKKKKKKKYSETLDAAGKAVDDRMRVMLALDFNDHKHKLTYPVTVQPKLDGARCLAVRNKAGEVILQSRGNDVYKLDHISAVLQQNMPDDTVFDGELYLHGMSLQNILSLARRPRVESLQLVYCVYDVFQTYDMAMAWSNSVPSAVTRRSWLSWFFGNNSVGPEVWPVPYREAWNEDEVRAIQKELVAEGYEGAIIRAHEGTYRAGYRSPHLLKLKDFSDAEFRIIGFSVGRGKFSDVPIFKCVTADGKAFDATPKGSDEERREMLAAAETSIGKLLTVRYFDLSDDGIPRFPVGVAIREDSM